MRKLKRRKYIMHSAISVIALVIVTIYTFYYTKACMKSDYYWTLEHYQEWLDNVYRPLIRFIWISFLLLGIIFFVAGCVMLNRLRLYFTDFYKESGCKLWTANVLLTLPLTFRAIFDWLTFDDAWYNYWHKDNNRLAGFNILLIFFATYMPMLLQISTLIFGFVGKKKVKLFKNDRNSISRNFRDT